MNILKLLGKESFSEFYINKLLNDLKTINLNISKLHIEKSEL